MTEQTTLSYLVGKALKYAGPDRNKLIGTWILLIFGNIVSTLDPIVLGSFLNALQQGTLHTRRDVLKYILVYFSIIVFYYLCHHTARISETLYGYRIKARFREHIFSLLTSLPAKWHVERISGESIDTLNKAADALSQFASYNFSLIYSIIRLISALVVLLIFAPSVCLMALVVTVLAFICTTSLNPKLVSTLKQFNKHEHRISSAVYDYLSNILTVIILRLEEKVNKELRSRTTVHEKLFLRYNILNEIRWFSVSTLVALSISIALIIQGFSSLNSTTPVLAGNFYILIDYLRRMGMSFFEFNVQYANLVRYAADVSGVEDIIEDHTRLVGTESESTLPDSWKTLTIESLYFRYEDEKKRVHHLDDLNIVLQKGKKYAFIGESGSGKSTALKLIRGVQHANSVNLYCDGRHIDTTLHALNTCTTLIPQDPEMFADTVRFNVCFGMECDEASIYNALEMARFAQVLPRLHKGIETNIAEKGVNLSGGEKQRLALARGIFFADGSDIILLDEPTSSVDTYNERLIYTRLLEHWKDKVVISALHRLHLLELFDEVYIFSEGRIIDKGSYKELTERSSIFQSMLENYQTLYQEMA